MLTNFNSGLLTFLVFRADRKVIDLLNINSEFIVSQLKSHVRISVGITIQK